MGAARIGRNRMRSNDLRRETTIDRSRTSREWSDFEALEPRVVLASPTAEDVLFISMLNRARLDPFAEGERLDVNVRKGLTFDERQTLGATGPLAFSSTLLDSARAHTLDMGTSGYFSSIDLFGRTAGDRARDAGYDGTAESLLSQNVPGAATLFESMFADNGLRQVLLGAFDDFGPFNQFTEFGIGSWESTTVGADPSVIYQLLFGLRDVPINSFGERAGVAPTYLVGTTFDDVDGDEFYDLGEGIDGIRIDVRESGGSGAIVGTFVTDASGWYQIELGDGAYDVVFTDTATGNSITRGATISGQNVHLDARLVQLNGTPDVPDAPAQDSRLAGSYDSDGRLTIVSRAGDGVGRAYQQSLGLEGWALTGLEGALQGQTLIGELQTWYDSKDLRTYAAVASTDGVLLLTLTGGTWSARNLNDEIAGARVLEGDLVVFEDNSQTRHIGGLDRRGDFVLFVQSRETDVQGNFEWTFRHVARDDLRARGAEMPTFQVGSLTSFVTSWNALNIAGLDTEGQVRTIWTADNVDGWVTSNLSAQTGAPRSEGALSVFLTSWNAINIAGVNAEGEIQVTWWIPGFQGWRLTNLTEQFDGPTVRPESLTSYVLPWGGLNVGGVNSGGKAVVFYWWVPGGQGWRTTRLTDLVTDPELPATWRTCAAGPGGRVNLISTTAEGDVYRLYWQPGDRWDGQNISELFEGA